MKTDVGLGGHGWIWLLLATLAATAGCANTTDSPTDPGGVGGQSSTGAGGTGTSQTSSADAPQTIDDFAKRFADRYCQSIAACCSHQGFATTDCETTLLGQIRPQLQLTASKPKIHYNAQAAQGCIDAYAAALSACTDHELLSKTDDACDGVFEGTVPVGGACGTSQECAGADTGVSCMTGVCVQGKQYVSPSSAAHRKLGQTCSGTCRGTSSNASCDGSVGADVTAGACWTQDDVVCTNGVCVAAPQVGQSCVSFGYCTATAHCQNSVCVADQSSGPCTTSEDCLAPSVCDYTLQMCVALKQNGEACDQSDQCAGGQCYEDHCRTWTVAQTDSCLGVLDD